MKKITNQKAASAVRVIGGADGPTSVFLVGKNGSKRTLKQNICRILFTLRKKCIARFLKANPHTIDQVIRYAKRKWGYRAISKNTNEYKAEYAQTRASFILQYKPELLGEFKEHPSLTGRDEESIRRFMELMDKRQKAAEAVPVELFDIDLCILERKKRGFRSKLIFEKKYAYIGASASGRSKKEMKRDHKVFRDVYRYYGVSQNDMDHQTKRYEEVLGVLAGR